jgi:hypothetical protein
VTKPQLIKRRGIGFQTVGGGDLRLERLVAQQTTKQPGRCGGAPFQVALQGPGPLPRHRRRAIGTCVGRPHWRPSRCHRGEGDGPGRFKRLATCGPNVISSLTRMPRPASNASTSRRLSVNRKYSHTAWRMTVAAKTALLKANRTHKLLPHNGLCHLEVERR